MIGVVLWSDPREGKAVIWCEDHGDLAFYRNRGAETDLAQRLDAGDLVAFDIETVEDLRIAQNPTLVEGGVYRDLPDVLSTKVEAPMPIKPDKVVERRSAEIIPLFGRLRQTQDGSNDFAFVTA